ncbi:unnamed protein product [Malus baccata var. baccata]
MGEVIETLPAHRSSFAAPIVFIVVVAFQFLSRWLEQLKKGGVKNATATRLRGEIKDLLKEASSLSQPSTFAQANLQIVSLQLQPLDYWFMLIISICRKQSRVNWFWRVPVASISQQLVQPFGNVFPIQIYFSSPLFPIEIANL